MARSGRFGTLPRSAPDLTNEIVALLREYNNMVDQNYVDAWQNGGKVDGKAVTDDRLLKHFRERRAGLSKSDPLWTVWDNRITQYQFSIEESKMQVRYDNGKASDMDMSRFYGRWAAKTPNNTEFDRTLLSAMGKFRAAAAARSAAGAAAAAQNAFNNRVTSLQDDIKPSQDVINALVTYAATTGIAPGAKTLQDVEVATGGIDRLWDLIQDGVDGVGGQVGNEAQLQVLNKALEKSIPGFSWSNGEGRGQITDTLERGERAAQRGSRYVKNSDRGTQEWQNFFDGSLDAIQAAHTRINGLDPMAQLKANRDKRDRAIEAANGDPYAEKAAYEAYFAANDQIVQTLIQGQVGDEQDWVVTGIVNEKSNYLNVINGNNVQPLSTWSTTAEGAAHEVAALTAMREGADLLDKGGWLQITEDPNDPTQMTYEVMPSTAPRGANSVLMPGSGVRSSTGAIIPVYAVPQDVLFYTAGTGGGEVAAPAYAHDANGNRIPVTKADGTQAVDPQTGQPAWQELGNDTGVRAFRLMDADGKPYTVFQKKQTDGTWGPMLLNPPTIPGADVRVTQAGGDIVLEFTVTATSVAAAEAAKGKDAAAATAQQPVPGVQQDDIARLGADQALHGVEDSPEKAAWYEKYGAQGPLGQPIPGMRPMSPDERDEANAAAAKLIDQQQYRNAASANAPGPDIFGAIGDAVIPFGREIRAARAAADEIRNRNTSGSPDERQERADQAAAAAAQAAGAQATAQLGQFDYDVRDFIDTTADWSGRPDTYNTILALGIAHEFDKLDLTNPADTAKVPALVARVNSGAQDLQAMRQYFIQTGDQQGLTQVDRDIAAWDRDKANLDHVVISIQSGIKPNTSLNDPTDPENARLIAAQNRSGGPTSFSDAAARSAGDSTPTSRFLLTSKMRQLEFDGVFGPPGPNVPERAPGETAALKAGANAAGAATNLSARLLKLPEFDGLPFGQALAAAAQGAAVPQLAANVPGSTAGPGMAAKRPTPMVENKPIAAPASSIAAPKPIEPPKPDEVKPPPAPTAPPPAPAPVAPPISETKRKIMEGLI